MNIDLSGHVAVVTGAGSGIGRKVAGIMAEAGAQVAVADINASASDETVELINKVDGHAEAFEVDVTSLESIRELQASTSRSMGLCDIVVNCAGWNVGQPFLENNPEFIEHVVSLNLLGCIYMCREYLGPLVESGKSGWVVNVSSDAGRVGSLGETVYAASKGGVVAFTKSLAREMARYSINVNCVAPGPTDTPLFHLQPEKIQAALVRAIPLKRLGEPEEVANVIVFLASQRASYVTGQVLSVSGGLTMVD
ncbi:SDR family NAD(P)-dependent oxidoreductase [Ferrimicrobium acidiphilum]|jgi:2-hydroxycyclohexanecarboxyl-CoA dehydrogenase|uniref:3-oxoacyl-[acyl-carrier-protein] reductase FabG n=1 Tax=Ferrimicrobium acidiphilum DSM 19497 TaxID=1121877 RepID=A0A0D8FT66_9ACTN|nr:SDR family NAD(P)-dependent oxidoreductase [Ferrimicrobium acidiphilum]KJE75442.1 3-oxoacyl-[acyl-carrier-protein] reductase FabG [Ferrimicrobium acidiphilum DSM 19497]